MTVAAGGEPGGHVFVDLYWIPLGAGGWFVKRNGRLYEAVVALRDRRPRRDLYHSALEVVVPEGRFVIEQAPVQATLTAVESPRRLSTDSETVRRLLRLAPDVPTPVWGRDELATGDMWNSNSVISWLVTRSGLDPEEISLPVGGRAPGWHAGILAARRNAVGPGLRRDLPALG